jgi:hypothetical protein
MINASSLFFGAATLASIALTVLLTFETWALATGHQPITGYVRHAVENYPKGAFVVAIALGMLLGHFFWPTRY